MEQGAGEEVGLVEVEVREQEEGEEGGGRWRRRLLGGTRECASDRVHSGGVGPGHMTYIGPRWMEHRGTRIYRIGLIYKLHITKIYQKYIGFL